VRVIKFGAVPRGSSHPGKLDGYKRILLLHPSKNTVVIIVGLGGAAAEINISVTGLTAATFRLPQPNFALV
jgi:hypothetical protein